jgi:predicted DNA-binding transcriptional regulator AlpA
MNANSSIAPGAGQTPAREYEDKKQLAARLGISVRTVDNLLTRKLVRFPRVAVDEWLAERQVRRT